MTKRGLALSAALLAVLLFIPTLAMAAPPVGIPLTDGAQTRYLSLGETLDFLRAGYTDLSTANDALSYARDLRDRGTILAYFLSHSKELARAGFFDAQGPATRRAMLACLNADFVSPELAESLTAKDILALHAVVYATEGPAIYDQFMAEKAEGRAIEGKRYAYLASMRECALQAGDRICQVRALSGMYHSQGELMMAAASTTATDAGQGCARTCQAAADKPACAAPCQKAEAAKGAGCCKDGKCACCKDGKCACGKDGKCCCKDGKCACCKDGKCGPDCKCGDKCPCKCGQKKGACASDGNCLGKCAGACKTDDKCAGACKTDGKCSGACKAEGKCSGACLAQNKCRGKCSGAQCAPLAAPAL
jgi:hypothetical protein